MNPIPITLGSIAVVKGDMSPSYYSHLCDKGTSISCDTETTGLNVLTDSMCSFQVCAPGLGVEIIKITDEIPARLITILQLPHIRKIFHHAVFDLCFVYMRWGALTENVVCTKVASRLLRTLPTDNHSLQTLLRMFLGVELDKGLRLQDWTSSELTPHQMLYAANDVWYLDILFERMVALLVERKMWVLAQRCFDFLPARVELVCRGYDSDIYQY